MSDAQSQARTEKIVLQSKTGPITVDALVMGGLAVHAYNGTEKWTISSVKIGSNLAGAYCIFERFDDALAAMREIVPLLDWANADALDVMRARIGRRIIGIACGHGGRDRQGFAPFVIA